MQQIQVLYEDNHIIAINKNVSQLVQGDKTGDTPLANLVADYIKVKYNKPGNVFVGVVHRLDRPVSGVVLFARTSKALERLNKMFKDKNQLDKIYWAIVKNKPNNLQGELVDFLSRNEKLNKSFVCKPETPGAKEARLQYKLIGQSNGYFLLEIKLITGRHHQIRAQLAAMGCPIKGDLKYGFPRSNPDAGISLHARKIVFLHPVQKNNVEIIAPVPDNNLWKFFEQNVK